MSKKDKQSIIVGMDFDQTFSKTHVYSKILGLSAKESTKGAEKALRESHENNPQLAGLLKDFVKETMPDNQFRDDVRGGEDFVKTAFSLGLSSKERKNVEFSIVTRNAKPVVSAYLDLLKEEFNLKNGREPNIVPGHAKTLPCFKNIGKEITILDEPSKKNPNSNFVPVGKMGHVLQDIARFKESHDGNLPSKYLLVDDSAFNIESITPLSLALAGEDVVSPNLFLTQDMFDNSVTALKQAMAELGITKEDFAKVEISSHHVEHKSRDQGKVEKDYVSKIKEAEVEVLENNKEIDKKKSKKNAPSKNTKKHETPNITPEKVEQVEQVDDNPKKVDSKKEKQSLFLRLIKGVLANMKEFLNLLLGSPLSKSPQTETTDLKSDLDKGNDVKSKEVQRGRGAGKSKNNVGNIVKENINTEEVDQTRIDDDEIYGTASKLQSDTHESNKAQDNIYVNSEMLNAQATGDINAQSEEEPIYTNSVDMNAKVEKKEEHIYMNVGDMNAKVEKKEEHIYTNADVVMDANKVQGISNDVKSDVENAVKSSNDENAVKSSNEALESETLSSSHHVRSGGGGGIGR